MFCLRNQDITDAKAFFYLFFMSNSGYIISAFDTVAIALTQPQGGYALWLQLPEEIDSLEMYRYAQKQGVNIVPGEVFGEDQRYKNYIQLNAGHKLSVEICQAIDLLADWTRKKINRLRRG